MPSVKVQLNNIPKGRGVAVPGLGRFNNGETTEVEQREWDIYLRVNPRAKSQIKGDTLHITTEQYKQGTEATEAIQEASEGGSDLTSLTRDKLEAVALNAGVDNPSQYGNKNELVKAIEEANGQEA